MNSTLYLDGKWTLIIKGSYEAFKSIEIENPVTILNGKFELENTAEEVEYFSQNSIEFVTCNGSFLIMSITSLSIGSYGNSHTWKFKLQDDKTQSDRPHKFEGKDEKWLSVILTRR
jgi:hypothetical protein